MEELTESQTKRIQNIDFAIAGLALLGSIGGIMYAKKSGGGALRYVGYWIVGGLAIGVPSRLIALPFKNNIIKNG